MFLSLFHPLDIRKSFGQSPTSLRLELGSRAELHCEPPGGFPEPKLSWHKNNAVITADNEPGISVAGSSLTFRQVALQHMANYSCSAENIAGKRVSDSAVLIVYGQYTSKCGLFTYFLYLPANTSLSFFLFQQLTVAGAPGALGVSANAVGNRVRAANERAPATIRCP